MSTRLQLLRYPFSNESRQMTQRVARDVGELINIVEDAADNYVVREAEARIFASLEQKEIETVNTNRDLDFLIYQTARLIVEKISDNRLKQYQAEAESKAVNKHLGKERDEYVVNLCRDAFNWDVEFIRQKGFQTTLPSHLQNYDVQMHFQNFLEVAPRFHSDEWKLVNRYVEGGKVPVRKSELHRLMSEKFKVLILQSTITVPPLPKNLTQAVQEIESELRTKLKKTEPIKITTTTVTAFPPCIAAIHTEALEGKNLSHEARFTLAAFLLKIGMSQEEVTGIFKPAPDFVRGLAEYQVRHIASKSGGEGYTPPSCRKLQGNSLCPVYMGIATDPLCEYITHPLGFYQTRSWEITKSVTNHSWYSQKMTKRQSF